MHVAKTKTLISFAIIREADLRLFFRLCRLLVFSQGSSYMYLDSILPLNCHYHYSMKFFQVSSLGNSIKRSSTLSSLGLKFISFDRVSIEGVKNLCPMLKILVCQFRIYSPKNIHSKFIINVNLP